MSITIHSDLEAELRARAAAENISVEAYVERLIVADRDARGELELLAVEGIDSGEAFTPDADYWEAKHRQLDERLQQRPA